MKTSIVTLSRKVEKRLSKLPTHIKEALFVWVMSVEAEGISRVRLLPGYHDEPLKGDRLGQRSIRLSKAYRAFYVQDENSNSKEILVEEVNKHEY